MNEHYSDTEQLWREFSDHVRAFIRSKVGSDEEADDVLQDIFLRIHEGIDSLNHEDRVQSWVFGIARRALADHYRKKERSRDDRKVQIEEEQEPDEDADILNMADFEGGHTVHEEVLSWLIPMIDELPEKYRVPLRMADVEGKTQQEVADRLDLSLSGAKSRVQRGRKKLGELLSECCKVEFGEEGKAVAFRRLRDEECESCD